MFALCLPQLKYMLGFVLLLTHIISVSTLYSSIYSSVFLHFTN